MCDCIDQMNAKIADINGIIVSTYSEPSRPIIETMKLDATKRKKKAFSVLASFCPFCGEKYEDSSSTAEVR